MFINAEPRVVSNGFEAFIPFHRAEPVHQRLVEMTNNDVNAWSVCRPVASSTSSIWDQQVDDFDNENFSVNTSSEVEMQVWLILAGSKPLYWILPRSFIGTSKTTCRLFEDFFIHIHSQAPAST
jgi:hypothetical protein